MKVLAGVVSALLHGCGGLPERFGDCRDTECRKAWLEAAWARNPGDIAGTIQQVQDPTERLVLVVALSEAHPGDARPLCDLLPAGAPSERCVRINERPHLRSMPPPPAPGSSSGRRAPGPPGSYKAVDERLRSAYEKLAPLKDACEGAPDPHGCFSALAVHASRQGAFEDAARYCLAIEPGKWRWECAFGAAEAAVLGQGAQGYRGNVELCLMTEDFREACMNHGTLMMAGILAPSSTQGAYAWRDVAHAAEVVEEVWKNRGAAAGPVFAERLWANSTYFAYENAPEVTGDPLDAVPPVAVPHVRVTAAMRLFSIEDPETRDLGGWLARLQQALAERAADVPRAPTSDVFRNQNNLWPVDELGEDAIPAVMYVIGGRRALGESEEADLAICLLEAAAHRDTPAWGLIAQGEGHPHPIVAWTARRLRQRLGGVPLQQAVPPSALPPTGMAPQAPSWR